MDRKDALGNVSHPKLADDMSMIRGLGVSLLYISRKLGVEATVYGLVSPLRCAPDSVMLHLNVKCITTYAHPKMRPGHMLASSWRSN